VAGDDCVSAVDCMHRMDDVWHAIRGEDGTGGLRGQLNDVEKWQVRKDAADQARADLLMNQQKEVKLALDKHNFWWMVVSVVIAAGMLLLAFLELNRQLKDHTLNLPTIEQSDQQYARYKTFESKGW